MEDKYSIILINNLGEIKEIEFEETNKKVDILTVNDKAKAIEYYHVYKNRYKNLSVKLIKS
ncbi:hypothetical protein [Salipaludibacillus aurantiacus]|uniref:Uncharacterized protein n=1 Tax=Salipaludibacillus aurantiacus TaxID=1601833 RepID=A0A1H9UGB9_9BACI|nr:hypothetical protein [Salipaludibacillus aurantiacus]SES08399.1 hypothetical protein SAMN05518684_107194 [Salipaludibacillus aurantiacus]